MKDALTLASKIVNPEPKPLTWQDEWELSEAESSQEWKDELARSETQDAQTNNALMARGVPSEPQQDGAPGYIPPSSLLLGDQQQGYIPPASQPEINDNLELGVLPQPGSWQEEWGRTANLRPGSDLELGVLPPESKAQAGGYIPLASLMQGNAPKKPGYIPPATRKVTEPEDRSFLQSVGDFFTGDDRQTEETKGLEEFDLPFEFSARQAKTALGLMTTFDPKKQVALLKDNYPDLTFAEDDKGNIIVDGSAYGGDKGVLNMPGVSGRDIIQAGFQMVAFTPAAKVVGLAATTLGKAGAVGAASAGTQAGLDIAGQAAGTTDDVSLGNIDKSDVAIAGVAGGGLELAFRGLSKFAPLLKRSIQRDGITDEVRETFRRTAVEVGRNPDEITDEVIQSFIRSANESVDPKTAATLQGEREFGIGLTEGQRTGNQKKLSFEDSARAGIKGEKAQNIMLANEAKQNKQIVSAKNSIQERIGRGLVVKNQQEAGAVLGDAVRGAERQANYAVDEAFGQVGDAALNYEGVKGLLSSIQKSVRGFEFDRSLKSTRSVLEDVKRFQSITTKAGSRFINQPIKVIERGRRRLNGAIGSAENPTDKRQVVLIKKAYDRYLDEAVKNSLFVGDTEALNTLKASRALSAEYFKKFTTQPKYTKSGRNIADKEGSFIERIVSADPTNEQVINSLFGASGFNNRAGQNMAKRFKTIVGKDTDAWLAVKQAGFMRLIKFMPDGKSVSGQQTSKAILQAIDNNQSLMNELYTPAQIGTMKRFAAQVKRTQPDIVRSRENPSGTAQKALKSISDIFSRAGTSASIATGNPWFIIGGKGIEVGAGFRSASKASKAVKPFGSRLTDIRPAPVSAGTAGTVNYFNEESL